MNIREAASYVLNQFLNEGIPTDREHFGFIMPNGHIHRAQRHQSDIVPRDQRGRPLGHEELAQDAGFDNSDHAMHNGAVKFTMGSSHLHLEVPDNKAARWNAANLISSAGPGRKVLVNVAGESLHSSGNHAQLMASLRRS